MCCSRKRNAPHFGFGERSIGWENLVSFSSVVHSIAMLFVLFVYLGAVEMKEFEGLAKRC